MLLKLSFHKKSHNPFGHFSEGFKAPFSVSGFFWHHKKTMLPSFPLFVINLVLYILLFYASFRYLYPFFSPLVPQNTVWYTAPAAALVRSFIIIITLTLFSLIFSFVGFFITAPLSAKLSQMAEGKSGSGDALKHSLGLKAFVRFTVYILLLLILLVVFNLIAFGLTLLINHFTGGTRAEIDLIIKFILSLFILFSILLFIGAPGLALPLLNRNISIAPLLRYTIRYKWLGAGFGLAFFIMSVIPVVSGAAHILVTVSASIIYTEEISTEISLNEKQ